MLTDTPTILRWIELGQAERRLRAAQLAAAHQNAQAVGDTAYAATRGTVADKAVAYHRAYQRTIRSLTTLGCPCACELCQADFGKAVQP